MNTNSGTWTAVEGVAFVIGLGAFFFDIVGVFGLAFAVTGMLIAVALVISVCLKRPSEDQAQ